LVVGAVVGFALDIPHVAEDGPRTDLDDVAIESGADERGLVLKIRGCTCREKVTPSTTDEADGGGGVSTAAFSKGGEGPGGSQGSQGRKRFGREGGGERGKGVRLGGFGFLDEPE
jgi:hypothetical protein